MQKDYKTWYLLLLSVSHLLNDAYIFILPTILVLWRSLFNLSYFWTTLIVTSSVIVNLVSGPLFGYLSDRFTRRWFIAASLALNALSFSCMGLASSFEIVFILALLGRVGATIFHPLASKIVINYESGKRVRSMTVFTIGGTIGRALSPVLVGLIVSFFGLRGLTLILLPGLIASVALFLVKPPSTFESSPEISLSPPKKATFDSSRKKGFISLGMLPLLLISVVVFTRSVGEMGMITFIPFFLGSKGIELLEATFYLSVMLSVGIAGELMGGVLSDRYGRKPLIVASLAVCSPLIYLFLHTETSLSLLPIALYGLIIALPVATLIVLAAEFAPKRVGFASGLVWSLMSGSGGLLAMGFGLIADKLGLFLVLHLIALFPLIAGLIALALPKQKRS